MCPTNSPGNPVIFASKPPQSVDDVARTVSGV